MSAQHSILQHIARPYATALFDIAGDAGKVDEIESELVAVNALANESADFSRFLQSPVITGEVKRAAVEAILKKARVSETVGNFVKLVAKNNRLFALTTMIASYRALAAKARGEVTAEVTSAAPLSKAQVSALADALKKKIGKTVNLDEHVDPSLIGGLVVKVGSQMIDSSLKTKLTAMKIAMKEVG